MVAKGRRVRKHRIITDPDPFDESIKSLHDLTGLYGYENQQRQNRIKSDLFEHYVAYALYMWIPNMGA